MSLFDRIARTIMGRDFGLDRDNNLLMRGSSIILSYDSASPVTISAASSGGAAAYAASVSASLAASQNNYAPTGFNATKNRLLLAAAGGGSSITGLSATGVADGASLLIRNTSATDSITFPHLSGSSSAANQFSCPNGADAVLQPLAATLVMYIVNKWVFAS